MRRNCCSQEKKEVTITLGVMVDVFSRLQILILTVFRVII